MQINTEIKLKLILSDMFKTSMYCNAQDHVLLLVNRFKFVR